MQSCTCYKFTFRSDISYVPRQLRNQQYRCQRNRSKHRRMIITAVDGIRHQSWVIQRSRSNQEDNFYLRNNSRPVYCRWTSSFSGRSKSWQGACKYESHHRGDEEYNFFLAVYFPASQLRIMDYNRLVRDLYGMTKEEFFEKLKTNFNISEASAQVSPVKKGDFGMYLERKWYTLSAGTALQNNI